MTLNEDLITLEGVADLGDVDPGTVKKWVQQPGFPKPVAEPEAGPLFSRGAVREWLLESGREGIRPPL